MRGRLSVFFEFRMILLRFLNMSLYALAVVVNLDLLAVMGQNSFLDKPGEIGLNFLHIFLSLFSMENFIDCLMNWSQQIRFPDWAD